MAKYEGGGWTGKILRVDLTTRTATAEDTFPKYEKYWGGAGLGWKVLWDETTGATKWDDADNRIILSGGPLVGTSAPTAGRLAITTLSPYHQLSAVQTAHQGGHFAADLKFAGWDAIIIQGKASNLVFISIIDDKVEIVDCPEMKGVGHYRTTFEIQAKMGANAQVISIGPAGENLVNQANLLNNFCHSGQGGAVWGSKNLKGIGVIGTGVVKIAGDKRQWRAVIDNALLLTGSNNQGVVPNNRQAWAELSPGASGTRWYAGPGKWWGAASPPLESGICLPHDRQKLGFRCFKADPGVNSYPFTVRMDGCFSCPVRCHQMIEVPSAAKWGVDPKAQQTCTAWWGRDVMHNATMLATVSTQAEKDLLTLESYVVAKHMTDDLGISNNYGTTNRGWTYIVTNGPGGAVAVADQTTKNADVRKWSYLQLNIPDAEWSSLTGSTGLMTLRGRGDLRAIAEWGRIVSQKIGELGKFLAGEVKTQIETWTETGFYDFSGETPVKMETRQGDPIKAKYEASGTVAYWAWGFPKHHSFENGQQVGGLINTGYNRDCMNHSWVNTALNTGIPQPRLREIHQIEFNRVGWGEDAESLLPAFTDGSDWRDAIDTASVAATPINEAKARAAWFCLVRQVLHDSLGICNWNWPYVVSPLKERGYRGDLTLEAKMFSIATGKQMNCMELDREAMRFYHLHRVLTARTFKTKLGEAYTSMRDDHDVIPPWGLHYLNNDDELAMQEWQDSLDEFYKTLGYDDDGMPTRATLEHFGMKDVADALGLPA